MPIGSAKLFPVLFCFFILFFSAAMIFAQVEAPAPGTADDAPATAPATAPVDPTTPKGSLKLLAHAMERGDVETIRQLVQAESPVEQKMLAAQVEQAQAVARLRAALAAQFGPAAVDELMAGQPDLQAQQEAIDAAEAEVNGETASVKLDQDVYELKRVNGKWVVLLKPVAETIDPQLLDRSLQDMSAKSTAIRETADEIAAGQYQNTDEVAQALQAKLWVTMMREASAREQGPAPATTPTTQPQH